MTMYYVTSSGVERSLCQTASEISPLHLAHKCLCARFRSKWQCIMSPRAESRGLFAKQCQRFLRSTSFWSKWQFFVIPSGVERSLCQTASEISPLHFVSVEMTMYYVTSSGVERSLCQTASEISPLHLAHKCLCDRFRSKWQCIMSPRAESRNLLPNGVWDFSAPLRSGRNDNDLCRPCPVIRFLHTANTGN